MATSGTSTTEIYSWLHLKFSWSQASQSVANNTTTINWKMELVTGNGDIYCYSKPWSVTINGVTTNGTAARIEVGRNSSTTLASGTSVITHNTDGTKSFSYSYKQTFNISLANGSYMSSYSGSGSGTLETIPRASSFTVSSASADMGTAVTFTVNSASTAFTHKFTLTWGSKTSDIASGIVKSYAWTIPLTLANDLPSSTSSGCIITCITYSGSTEIGRKTLSMTLKVPTSVKPSISSVTISEATSGLATKFGAYIQNKSKLKVVTAATGAYSSTIKTYSTKILNKTYSGSTITSNVIGSSGSVSVAVTVTDSRGRTATTTKTVTVSAYSDPSITKFTVQRCLSDGTLSDIGEYAKIAVTFSIAALSNKNDKSYTIAYKLKGSTSYTALTSGSVYSLNTTTTSTVVFNGDNSYDFSLTVTDYFKSVSQTANISTAFTLMDFHSSGTGMGIGKVAETANTLEVGLNTVFNKSLSAKKGIFFEDTRDTDLTPDEYRALGRGVYYEFKKCETVSLLDANHTFCVIETLVPWQNSSGGSVKQIAYDEDRIWYRSGVSTTWGAWKSIFYRMAWQAVSNGVSYKIHNGMCTVRGNSNTTLAISKSGVVACTLPAQARPTVEIFGTLTTKANACGQVSIGTDGKVTLWTFGSDTTYWAFTITYPVD